MKSKCGIISFELIVMLITALFICNCKRKTEVLAVNPRYNNNNYTEGVENTTDYFTLQPEESNNDTQKLTRVPTLTETRDNDIKIKYSVNENEEYWKKLGEEQLDRVDRAIVLKERHRPKNIIVFIGDGLGPTTIMASRMYRNMKNSKTEGDRLNLEKLLRLGTVMTYSTDNKVPGCGESAVAILSGVKTNYRVLGFDNKVEIGKCNEMIMNQSKVSTLADWATDKEKVTGIVTNGRVTGNTVAAFYAHTPDDRWECSVPENNNCSIKDTGKQLVEDPPGRYIRVILGGGRKYLGNVKNPASSCRKENLVDTWKKIKRNQSSTFKYVETAKELASVNPQGVRFLLGLFSDGDMAFNLQRKKQQPRLVNMMKKAIGILKNNPKGYVLLVEARLIGNAHENNYIKIVFDETNEFDVAVKWAMENTKETETLLVVTADHAGGLNMLGYPKRAKDILGKPTKSLYNIVYYEKGPSNLRRNSNMSSIWYQAYSVRHSSKSVRSGQNVLVYAWGPGAHYFSGNYEQSYIGCAFHRLLVFESKECKTYYALSFGVKIRIKSNFLILFTVLAYYVCLNDN